MHNDFFKNVEKDLMSFQHCQLCVTIFMQIPCLFQVHVFTLAITCNKCTKSMGKVHRVIGLIDNPQKWTAPRGRYYKILSMNPFYLRS